MLKAFIKLQNPQFISLVNNSATLHLFTLQFLSEVISFEVEMGAIEI